MFQRISQVLAENSAYFWGDLYRETITFVRNFVFTDINTMKMDPLMPYHDSRKPYVPYWFSASAGINVEEFCQLLNERNQDRLLEEGGACIAYSHLAFGFYRDGQLNPRFVELMRRDASRRLQDPSPASAVTAVRPPKR